MSVLLSENIRHSRSAGIPTLSGPGPALDRSELTRFVAKLGDDEATWKAAVHHDPQRRWWTRLVSNDVVDSWLITWPGSEGTDLHDHGASAAALTVVEGALEHVLASRGGDLMRETLAPGALLTVEPGAVHDVRNPTGAPTVSIHAYSPPLERMTFFRHHLGGLAPMHTLYANEPELEQPW